MADKVVDVDYGSMSLPILGDRGDANERRTGSEANADDVAKLQKALDRPGRSRQEQAGTSAEPSEQPPSPFSLLGAPDPARLAEPDDIGAEIERLWVAVGADGVREVRVKLRREILPDTSVRLFEDAGRLNIEMAVGGEPVRTWLASRLQPLARHLGERLQRPLRLVVSGMSESERSSQTLDWPEETER